MPVSTLNYYCHTSNNQTNQSTFRTISAKFSRGIGIVFLGYMLSSLFTVQAQGQEFWNHFLRPDVGASLYFYNLSDSANTENYNFVHLGFLVGLNLPFVPLAENLALGLNPSLGLSAQLTGYDASDVLSLELPLYATLKYNTDATWKGSKAPVGFAAGLGVQSSNLLFTYSGVTASYLVPSYLLEVNIGSRRGNKGLYKLRWTSYLGSKSEPLEELGNDKITFKQFALHILWVPGY